MGHLRKVYPNKIGSLDHFNFVVWYVDKEFSLDSAEEAELLVGWGCKVGLMDIKLAIFFKFHSLKREREQESLSLKEGSILNPTIQGRSSTVQLQQSR